MTPAIDLTKLKELILFVSELCKDKFFFGAIHLNKILYFSDFYHYKYTGNSITGAVYFKLQKGPAPKHMLMAQRELIAEGRAVMSEKEIAPGFKQNRILVTDKGKVPESVFTPLQLYLIHKFVGGLCEGPTEAVSNSSHDLNWELAALKEEIPYFVIHNTRVNKIDDSSKTWARELAIEAGLV